MQDVDVVVIGAGVAGLTAAMIAAERGANTLVIEQSMPGGQVATIERIRNFPGYPDGVAGYELGPLLQQQAEAAGAAVWLDRVSALVADDGVFRVICDENEIAARTVIMAAGSSLRQLGIAGESELAGRGVSRCAACDGPLFKGQAVAVIGGGDSAIDEALVLAGYASELTLVHRGRSPSARSPAVAQLAALPHVSLVSDADIVAIEGDRQVRAIVIRRGEQVERNMCGAVFVYPGLEPRSALLRDIVALDSDGHIETDLMMRTSLPGLFAAGDIRSRSVRLLASVAGDAATAAISAIRYLQTDCDKYSDCWQGDDLGVGKRSRSASGR